MHLRRHLPWLLTAFGLVTGLRAAERPMALAVTEISAGTVQLTLVDGPRPKPASRWLDEARGLAGQVTAVDGRSVTFEFAGKLDTLRLGDELHLTPEGGNTLAPPRPRPLPTPAQAVSAQAAPAAVLSTIEGGVSRIEGNTVWVAGGPRPSARQAGELRRDGALAGQVAWDGEGDSSQGWSGDWKPQAGAAGPRLGDSVRYLAAEQRERPEPPVTKPERRRPTPSGADNMVSVDDPVMRLMEALAGRGYIADAGRRQFAGDGVGAYTRLDIARFLAPTLARLVDDEHRWPVQDMDGSTAALLRGVALDFEPELRTVGVDCARALARIDKLAKPGLQVMGTAGADLAVSTGVDAFDGRARGSVFAAAGRQLTFSGTLGTESLGSMPAGRDRTTVDTAWLQWRPSRNLTLGLGRAAFRLGSGYHDLLWSDQARPPDRLMLDWNLSLFGRPLRIEEHVGYFNNNGPRVVALRRFEYQPWRPLTIAANEALITNRGSQAAASLVLPLYAVRFVSGNSSAGGYGNYLGSLEATVRVNRQWSVYGEFFVDDFDFSPSPPHTATRRGWLGGVQYTPAGALPGTSYRLEAAILPDTGTYLGQQDRGMSWTRGGYFLGHEYGPDASGFRLSVRQRLSPAMDLRLAAEHFTQLRESPVSPETLRLSIGAGYNLQRWWSIGLGYRYEHLTSVGAVAGNDRVDQGMYLEARVGY